MIVHSAQNMLKTTVTVTVVFIELATLQYAGVRFLALVQKVQDYTEQSACKGINKNR